MKYIHLIKLQQFAADNNIVFFEEAIGAILDILDFMYDAENETRISIGGYMAQVVPSATMEDVAMFLELYISRDEYNSMPRTPIEELPF